MRLGRTLDVLTGWLRGGIERLESRNEREFLPAALEVLETPPSPTGRIVAITIGSVFVIAFVWAIFGQVDELASAPGRILPEGRTKVVQATDGGVVRGIHVADGDRVAEGQVLIELDATATGADLQQLTHDELQARLDVLRLTALRLSGYGGAHRPTAPQDARPEDIAQAHAALRAQADQQQAKLAGIDQQIAEKRAEMEESGAQTAKIAASVPTLQEKARLHSRLRDQGFGTSFAFLDAKQQLSDAQNDLLVWRAKSSQARAATQALQRQRAEAVSGFANSVLTDLSKAQDRLAEMTQGLTKAKQKSSNTQLRAPTSGVVEDLSVHTVGAVVSTGQRLLMVVPDTRHMMVEAKLANRDVGFIHAGQLVALKVETFDFTRYGLLRGKVLAVSRDAVSDGSADETGTTPRPSTESPTYRAQISLDRGDMTVDGSQDPLLPGMAVIAEIRTGRRSILDYLLSPLAKKSHDAMHER